MVRLHVGLSELNSDIGRYAERFDMLEVRATSGKFPKAKTLNDWRKSTPAAFGFSVIVPDPLVALEGGVNSAAIVEELRRCSDILEARSILLWLPSTVHPTSGNLKKLTELASRLPGEGRQLFWEPGGLWERSETIEASKKIGLLPVFDAAQTALPLGPVVYTRIRNLGAQSTFSDSIAQRIAEQLRGRRDAWIVLEQRGNVARIKRKLVDALSVLPAQTSTVLKPGPGRLRADDEEQ